MYNVLVHACAYQACSYFCCFLPPYRPLLFQCAQHSQAVFAARFAWGNVASHMLGWVLNGMLHVTWPPLQLRVLCFNDFEVGVISVRERFAVAAQQCMLAKDEAR